MRIDYLFDYLYALLLDDTIVSSKLSTESSCLSKTKDMPVSLFWPYAYIYTGYYYMEVIVYRRWSYYIGIAWPG